MGDPAGADVHTPGPMGVVKSAPSKVNSTSPKKVRRVKKAQKPLVEDAGVDNTTATSSFSVQSFAEFLLEQFAFDKRAYMDRYNALHSKSTAVPGGDRARYAQELRQARREFGARHPLVRGVAKVRAEGNPKMARIEAKWRKLRVDRGGREFVGHPNKTGGGAGFKHRSEGGAIYRQNKAEARGARKYSRAKDSLGRRLGSRAIARGEKNYNRYSEGEMYEGTLQQFFDKAAYMANYNAQHRAGGGHGRRMSAGSVGRRKVVADKGLGRLSRSKKITMSNPSASSTARLARYGMKTGALNTKTSKTGIRAYIKGLVGARKANAAAGRPHMPGKQFRAKTAQPAAPKAPYGKGVHQGQVKRGGKWVTPDQHSEPFRVQPFAEFLEQFAFDKRSYMAAYNARKSGGGTRHISGMGARPSMTVSRRQLARGRAAMHAGAAPHQAELIANLGVKKAMAHASWGHDPGMSGTSRSSARPAMPKARVRPRTHLLGPAVSARRSRLAQDQAGQGFKRGGNRTVIRKPRHFDPLDIVDFYSEPVTLQQFFEAEAFAFDKKAYMARYNAQQGS